MRNDLYVKKSQFLAAINNEQRPQNQTFKKNFLKIKKLVMVKFLKDTVVIPKESEFFGFYQIGQNKEVLRMNETRLYQEDWIGLRALFENNQVDLIESKTDHLQFTLEWFNKTIINQYLR